MISKKKLLQIVTKTNIKKNVKHLKNVYKYQTTTLP